MKQALAMVETKGFVAAMEAADAALKSASVELLGWKKAGGGLVAIFFTGDVASAKAALESRRGRRLQSGLGGVRRRHSAPPRRPLQARLLLNPPRRG